MEFEDLGHLDDKRYCGKDLSDGVRVVRVSRCSIEGRLTGR